MAKISLLVVESLVGNFLFSFHFSWKYSNFSIFPFTISNCTYAFPSINTSALIPLSKVETCPDLDQIQSKSCWYSLKTCLGSVMLDGSPTRKRPSSTGDCQTETLEANFLYLDSGQGHILVSGWSFVVRGRR